MEAGKYNDASLAPHADKILLINGLDNHAEVHKDGPGDHARGTPTFLTCVHPLKHASNIQIGPRRSARSPTLRWPDPIFVLRDRL